MKSAGHLQFFINGKPTTFEDHGNWRYTVDIPGDTAKAKRAFHTTASRLLCEWIKGNNDFEAKKAKFIEKHSRKPNITIELP